MVQKRELGCWELGVYFYVKERNLISWLTRTPAVRMAVLLLLCTCTCSRVHCSSHTQLGLLLSIVGGLHAAPTETHSFVRGQHTSVELAHLWVASQNTPGAVGVKQCLASGQQYSVALHCGVGAHTAPTATQILVRGQHTSPPVHAVASFTQLFIVGVRQCFASRFK